MTDYTGSAFDQRHGLYDGNGHVLPVVYELLENASPDGKAEIVCALIDQHSENRLVLPKRKGRSTYLDSVVLKGFHLAGAELRGATLTEANLENATLDGAHLEGAFLNEARLKGASLRGAHLLRANLDSAQLQQAHLEHADLTEAWLWGARLGRAFLAGARLDRTTVRWAQFDGTIGEELEAKKGSSLCASERAELFRRAQEGYLILKRNFDGLGLYKDARRAYRRERRMEKHETYWSYRGALALNDHLGALKNGLQALTDQIAELLCDYGESVFRVVAWAVALLLVVGPVLLCLPPGPALTGWTDVQEAAYRHASCWRWFYVYSQFVLYSLDTLTTAKFSSLEPATDAVRFMSGFLSVAGIFLAGLLGFVAGNRIRRS